MDSYFNLTQSGFSREDDRKSENFLQKSNNNINPQKSNNFKTSYKNIPVVSAEYCRQLKEKLNRCSLGDDIDSLTKEGLDLACETLRHCISNDCRMHGTPLYPVVCSFCHRAGHKSRNCWIKRRYKKTHQQYFHRTGLCTSRSYSLSSESALKTSCRTPGQSIISWKTTNLPWRTSEKPYSCSINKSFWSSSPIPSGPWRNLCTSVQLYSDRHLLPNKKSVDISDSSCDRMVILEKGNGESSSINPLNPFNSLTSQRLPISLVDASSDYEIHEVSGQQSSLTKEVGSVPDTSMPSWYREPDETKSVQTMNTFRRFTSALTSVKKRILNFSCV